MSKVGAICYKYEIPRAIEKYEITIGLAEEDLEETIKDKKKLMASMDYWSIRCYLLLFPISILHPPLHVTL